MYWSKSFIPTLKEVPEGAEIISHQLMLRAGLIRMLVSGVYSYLPLGLKVLNKIEGIVRDEMNKTGAQELLLPSIQSEELWIKSGRNEQIGEVMIRFIDRKKRRLCLGPTHEEVITDLVKNNVNSYKQLPLVLYQIQTKFRDEIRPRFGLIRACEFVMKDAYSFDCDKAGLDEIYQKMFGAYMNIFKRCGLEVITIEADPGLMGGNLSHEFLVPAASGEDKILICKKCKSGFAEKKDLKNCSKCNGELMVQQAIEIGHIFQLGTKYSQTLGAYFLDEKGKKQPMVMGCYGIGVSRLIATIIEQNNDQDGILWPREVNPAQILVLPVNFGDIKIKETSLKIYQKLLGEGFDVIIDDRFLSAGIKFKDADLIGFPIQVIIGAKLVQNTLEIKFRRENKSFEVKLDNFLEKIKELI
ncbi:MAG: proline--tRNA ligase [Candidatus Omnitrophota bacterium]